MLNEGQKRLLSATAGLMRANSTSAADVNGGRDVFCHRSACAGIDLKEGDRVKFTTVEDARNHRLRVDTISLCDADD